MLIFKGINTSVEILKEDTFYVMVTLHKYMKSKLQGKDHVLYYNYKGTNQDYWGESYKYLEKIIQLPIDRRKKITYIIFKESSYGESLIFFYYNKKGYSIELNRKHKGLKCTMDRLQEIFKIEDERRFFLKNWMYLRYITKLRKIKDQQTLLGHRAMTRWKVPKNKKTNPLCK
jgi:hypothetical protein